MVACEEILAAGLEPRPLLPLRELREPRRLQPPLRLVWSRRKQVNSRTESAETIREEKTREKERERGVRTDGVEGSGRRVEEVDKVGDDGSDGGHGRRGDCSMGTLVRSGVECSAVPLYALFNLFNILFGTSSVRKLILS